jgi:hypothetical protein
MHHMHFAPARLALNKACVQPGLLGHGALQGSSAAAGWDCSSGVRLQQRHQPGHEAAGTWHTCWCRCWCWRLLMLMGPLLWVWSRRQHGWG